MSVSLTSKTSDFLSSVPQYYSIILCPLIFSVLLQVILLFTVAIAWN